MNTVVYRGPGVIARASVAKLVVTADTDAIVGCVDTVTNCRTLAFTRDIRSL